MIADEPRVLTPDAIIEAKRRKGGRPRKHIRPATLFDPDRCALIIQHIKAGLTIEGAAALAGVSKTQFYKWLRRGATGGEEHYRKFNEDVQLAKSQAVAIAELKIAASPDWKATAWWLERRAPETYGTRQQIDINVTIEAQVRHLAAETGADYDKLLAAAQHAYKLLQSGEAT